jgi:hypothetical protein
MNPILISFKNPFYDEEVKDIPMFLNVALHMDGNDKRMLISGTATIELNADNTIKETN